MNERPYDNGYGQPYRGGDVPVVQRVPQPLQQAKTRWYSTGPVRLMIGGGAGALIGFLLLYTPVLLAYKIGTLSDEHGLCSSALGVFARGYSSQANSVCSQADGWYAFGMFLLWGGVAAAVGGLVWFLVRNNQRKVEAQL